MSSDASRRRVETGDLATQAALRVPAPPLPKAPVPGPVRVSAKAWRPTPGDGDLATATWRPIPGDGDLATATWRPTPGDGDLATVGLATERKQTYEKPKETGPRPEGRISGQQTQVSDLRANTNAPHTGFFKIFRRAPAPGHHLTHRQTLPTRRACAAAAGRLGARGPEGRPRRAPAAKGGSKGRRGRGPPTAQASESKRAS